MKKYYYIDDEVDTVKSYADAINEFNLVHVDVFPLSEYKEFDNLTRLLRKEWDSIDGLILDLKLDGGGENSTHFSATSLAQWIASYVVAEEKAAKPIVLLSSDLQCAKYKVDITSHDLFDMVLERNHDLEWHDFANKLKVLAEDYCVLNHNKKLTDLLQNDSIDFASTYFAPFLNPTKFNVSQFASFILNDLFKHPGLLISEELLAARFGVDIDKSGDSWKTFKEKYLRVARYKGIFYQIKECYWSKKALDIFYELSGGRSAASMTTIQRVNKLKTMMAEDAKDLVAYEPDDKSISTYCWAIDEATRKPLDSSEGYMILEEGGLKPWQEPRFLSFDTIESGKQGDYNLIPSESDRFMEDLVALKD